MATMKPAKASAWAIRGTGLISPMRRTMRNGWASSAVIASGRTIGVIEGAATARKLSRNSAAVVEKTATTASSIGPGR